MSSAEGAPVPRELTVCRAFVELADAIAPEFDLASFLDGLAHHCVRLLQVNGVNGAGVVLPAQDDAPARAAGSTRDLRELAELELDLSDGPSIDSYRSGQPVRWNSYESAHDGRWRKFVAAARSGGYLAAHALPMRYGDTRIGAINLLVHEAGTPGTPGIAQDALALGQALADVATMAILQRRALREQQVLAQQLQTALDSRVVIEQAKGILAERLHVSVAEAFGLIRGYARRNRKKLSEVARSVVDGETDITRRPG